MEHFRPDVLISEEDINLRIDDLARAINTEFAGEEIVVICILKGAFMFCSDLIKKLELPVRLDFMQVSSYGEGTVSSGNVKLEMDVSENLKDQNILIVEDIVDTGLTINTLVEMLKVRNPKKIKLASLLFKPSRNKFPVNIDYLGFEIEDKFVIGYGLDYAGRYRELPYIGVLNAGN